MNLDDIKRLLAKAQEDGQTFEFFGPQTEDTIVTVENALGVTFPPEYRAFLRELGGGGGIDNPISGICAADPLSECRGSVYGDTMRTRKEVHLPEHYVVVYFDFNTCARWVLDTTAVRDDGTTPVFDFSSASAATKRKPAVEQSFGDLLRTWFG